MADEQPHDESQQRAGSSKLRRLKYSLGSSSSLTEPVADLIGPNIELHHVKYHEKPPA